MKYETVEMLLARGLLEPGDLVSFQGAGPALPQKNALAVYLGLRSISGKDGPLPYFYDGVSRNPFFWTYYKHAAVVARVRDP